MKNLINKIRKTIRNINGEFVVQGTKLIAHLAMRSNDKYIKQQGLFLLQLEALEYIRFITKLMYTVPLTPYQWKYNIYLYRFLGEDLKYAMYKMNYSIHHCNQTTENHYWN